jgi:hypothetical protein
MKKCAEKYCVKSVKYGKCSKHASRDYRKKHPLKSAYITLKYNAKRRGKVFELTFEQFSSFVVKTNYIKGRGKKKDSYHIDRIDESQGYTSSNIQVLTNTQNMKKYLQYYTDHNGKPDGFKTNTGRSEEESPSYLPF